jgi:YegS/Rv2252/BmrU family lipid kinase
MKRLLLIYNPHAGDGHIRRALSSIVDFFTASDYEVVVHPSQFSGDAKLQIQNRAKQFDTVVVCGGDGMLHEAVNGFLSQEGAPSLGYIPSGTVNDFASTHSLSKNTLEAAKTVVNGKLCRIDAGAFNNDFFSYVAAFGIATSVSYDTPQDKKNRLGSAAYVLQALNVVDFTHWENNCSSMKITWENGECEGDFLYGMVSNSRYVAGMDQFTRNLFDWQDGLLEGTFIRRPMNIAELNSILSSILMQDFNNPLMVQVQSPWFRFEAMDSSKAPAWTLDGEYGGNDPAVDIHVVKGGLPIMLPRKRELSYAKAGQNPERAQTERSW